MGLPELVKHKYLVGGAAVTYTQFLTRAAYVNAHLSDADMATIVAQGNIGSSVGVLERLKQNIYSY
jgi:hypothetical protein